MPQVSCSQSTHLWAAIDFVRCYEALGTPPYGRGFVANRTTCGPLAPRLEVLGTHKRTGVM